MLLDTKFTGNIITMDHRRPRAQSMGVWNGLIVGFDEELDGMQAAEQHDFGTGSLVPGFFDAHTHLAATGMNLQGADVSEERDVNGLLIRVAEEAAKLAPGEWLEIWGYDQRNIGRHVTPQELERAAPQNPTVVRHVSSHVSVLNIRGISLLPDGEAKAKIEREDGLAFEKMQDLVRDLVEPYRLSKIESAIRAAAQLALSEGVTTSIEAGVGRGFCAHSEIDVRAFINLHQRDELGIRVQLMPCIDYLHPLLAHPDDHATSVLDLGLQQGFGGDDLWLGPTKLWFDGGMMARSAAFTEPYEGTDFYGALAEDESELQQRVIEAHRSGWDVAAHAIGDYAIESAITAFEEAQRIAPDSNRRHRIEHGALIRDDHLKRLARLSMSIGSQPCFITYSGDDFHGIMGPNRAHKLYRGRTLLDAGVRLLGSTDRPLPGTPLLGIKALMDRKTTTGQVLGVGEELTGAEALAAYTLDPAWAARRENRLGTLSAGKHADITVLSEDILSASADAIGSAGVLATFVGGVRRFEQ